MNLKFKLTLLATLLFNVVLFAQNSFIVTGQVSSKSDGLTLIGATVLVQGTTNGVSTDFDGNYSIEVKKGDVLNFSFVGFVSQLVIVDNQTEINIVLEENISNLEDVVVIGYGTQKRSSVTGSVAKLKSDKIESAPVSRLDQAIQGKIAGVRVQNISSEAGADTQINIRGVSSVNAGSGPLIVVDGQPLPAGDSMGAINNADVESVEVLKDAASAAIYGSRGANGVILITTKSGKEGKAKFNFRSTTGFKQAYDTWDIMTSTEYVERLYAESDLRIADPLWTGGTTRANTIGSLNKFLNQYAIEGMVGATDYQDFALRTATYKDIQFNVSGGGKTNKYYISTGYQGDEGLMLNSNFEKLNVRVKYDSQLTDKLKLRVNMNPSQTKTERPGTNFTDFYRFPSFMPIYHTQVTADYINAADPTRNIQVGDFAEDDDFAGISYSGIAPDGVPFTTTTANGNRPFNTGNTNPARALSEQADNTKQFRFQGSVALEYEITEGLDFRTSQSIFVRNTERVETGMSNAARFGNPNYATYTNVNYSDFLTENTLNYKKSFGEHEINVLGGFTFQSRKEKSLVTAGNTFSVEGNYNLNFAANISQPIQSIIPWGLISYLGRINYEYKNKYLLSASYRTDGSSVFAAGKKWGGFPAVSAGLVVSREDFMDDVESINKLTLRASYGATGNNGIEPFLFEGNLTNANYLTGVTSVSVSSGLANLAEIGSNSDITWERTFQTNLGMDLSMFKNRVNLNVDVYQSKTDKLLLYGSTMLTTGHPVAALNAGSLKNNGYEFEVSTVNVRTKDFTWSTDFNISHVKNEITSLGDKDRFISATIDGRNGLNNEAIVGQPLISFVGYKTDGVWNSTAEVNEAIANGLTSTLTNDLQQGGLKIVDINGDNVIDTNDRTILGNPYPDYTWGVTNNLKYKNIDLNFTLQGVVGGEIINGDINYNEVKERVLNFMDNRWVSPSNPGDGKTPYLTNGVNPLFTDFAIEDATYFTFREISLGYSFGSNVLSSIKLDNLRFSISGQNLLFVTKDYRGINIEARTRSIDPLLDGYQRGAFPIQKTILFNVEVGF